MGAETTIYVKVARLQEEWIEVQAVTMLEAAQLAERLPGIAMVLDTSYDAPHDIHDEAR